jgi:hypothetical protein
MSNEQNMLERRGEQQHFLMKDMKETLRQVK